MSAGSRAASQRVTRGLGFAAAIAIAWIASLVGLLSLDFRALSVWELTVAVLLRTQLQTGLFIIGHDAMHGLLCPRHPRWNHRIGIVMLALYAALPYNLCRANHHDHHRFTATAADPDVPFPSSLGALSWYRQFMLGYLRFPQMAALLAAWCALVLLFGGITASAALHVLLFCTLPLLLSSLQLFVFGTYLPHRRQRATPHAPHPDSLDLPIGLSLLACFHFGYHREHHDHPELAWFELPEARRARRALAPT